MKKDGVFTVRLVAEFYPMAMSGRGPLRKLGNKLWFDDGGLLWITKKDSKNAKRIDLRKSADWFIELYTIGHSAYEKKAECIYVTGQMFAQWLSMLAAGSLPIASDKTDEEIAGQIIKSDTTGDEKRETAERLRRVADFVDFAVLTGKQLVTAPSPWALPTRLKWSENAN